ncbi:MAG: response regulator [Candidatus Dadabacteria bacterium]
MNKRYIIFADDDVDDLELITGSFKEVNNEIDLLEFKDGKAVLHFLEQVSVQSGVFPRLIVLDINMPFMDGISTLTAIRQKEALKNIPVVIYTTSMTKNNIQLCKVMDASWLIKPTSVEQIRQTAEILSGLCNE